MTDMNSVIVPKSDQWNADDFIGGPRTFTIADVAISPGADQPVAIKFENGEGKVWRPCKSMSRVLVHGWKADARAYVGRSVTLYRDPKVKWGGMEVGGIRISHMTDIDRAMNVALTETKGKRAPFTVKPMPAPSGAPVVATPDPALLSEGRMAAERGTAALGAWWGRLSPAEKTALKPALDADLKPIAAQVQAVAMPDPDFPGDQP